MIANDNISISNSVWTEVASRVNQHGYMSGVDRMSERVKKTGEVFTPTDLVIEILRKIPVEKLGPGKTVLDPAAGDGQFLVTAFWVKVLHFGMSEDDARQDIYGVDLMRDNVDVCKRRLGGGNIVQGNTLCPHEHIEGQTDEERRLMIEWFGPSSLERFFSDAA